MNLVMECLIFFVYAISGLTLAVLITRFAFGKNLTYRLTFWLCPLVALVGIDSYVLGRFTIYNWTADLICVLFGTIVILGTFYVIGNFLIRKLQIIGDSVSEFVGEMLSASRSVSETSQTIAEGTSAQAAAIEETSASLEEMSAMIKRSVDNTDEAKSLMEKTKSINSNVNGHMNNMALAMQEISETSNKTAKIIKTIDEIAFQTNLLALNAAVEAARAGEAGAGFAVVAEEVRNLAMRASDAARNTSELIETILSAVSKGSELTPLTQSAFMENIEITDKISVLVDDIAAAREQEAGISQITRAVGELDRTSQSNAATSEESASASEEMSAQSIEAQEAVGSLLTLIHGSAR